MGIRSAKVKIYHVGRNKNESNEKSRLRGGGAYIGAGARLGASFRCARIRGDAGAGRCGKTAGQLLSDCRCQKKFGGQRFDVYGLQLF